MAASAECVIANAAELHSQLAVVLSQPSPLALDLSPVKRIDTAGIQVLAAFVRHRRSAGLEIHCVGACEPFIATARLLGLDALFASPVPA